ncbi:MAG: PAS domain S-box protein, partial [Magnetococcales bacterium]|nr:PAS domain S-box protein [Magnetococcales bacterium]
MPDDARQTRTPLILALGLGVGVMGFSVLLGWHTRSVWLVQWQPGMVPMMHNTALNFLLMGVGLMLAETGRTRRAMTLGLVVLLLSGATLAQYFVPGDFGIDQLLVRHFITEKASHPGRMAANTATGFIVSALGLLTGLLPAPRKPFWLMCSGTVTTALGVTAIIGYGMDLESACGWGNWTRMAIQTALAFLALGLGLSAMAWTRERRWQAGLPGWLPHQVFILLLSIMLAIWMAIQSAQTRPDTQEAIYRIIIQWFPLFGVLITLSIALLVHFYQTTRHRAGTMEEINQSITHYHKHLETVVAERTQEVEKANRALQQRNALFHSFIATTPDGFWITDLQGRILEVNDLYCQMTGFPRSEVTRLTIGDLDAKESGDELQSHLAAIQTSGVDRFSTLHRTKAGGTIPLEVSVTYDYKQNQFIALLRDMRPWNAMLEILRNERDRAQRFLDIAGVIIMALDRQGHITLINRKGCQVLGLEEGEILGQSWFNTFIPDGERPTVLGEYQLLLSNRSEAVKRHENWIMTRQQGKRLVAWWHSLILDDQGHLQGTLSSGEDITEHRKMEERLRQGEKMESIGVLSGGIAHNFNNLLAIILGNAELARFGALKPDDALTEIISAASRGKELVSQLLTFSHRAPMGNMLFPPELALKETIRFIRSVLPPAVQLTASIEENAGMIMGDAHQLQQVVINLATNAWQALEGHEGEIRITLSASRLEPSQAQGLSLAPGDVFELSVQDNGPGMAVEVKEHIFEPFFTTKEPGKGTGLGLSTVHGIIHNAQGAIVCDSAPDAGSLFRIYLPRHRVREDPPPPLSPHA